MKVHAESTDKITTIGGVPVRVWTATTEHGIPCTMYVRAVAVDAKHDCGEFSADLAGADVVPLKKKRTVKRPAGDPRLNLFRAE